VNDNDAESQKGHPAPVRGRTSHVTQWVRMEPGEPRRWRVKYPELGHTTERSDES
jgi:hypothetical protein